MPDTSLHAGKCSGARNTKWKTERGPMASKAEEAFLSGNAYVQSSFFFNMFLFPGFKMP